MNSSTAATLTPRVVSGMVVSGFGVVEDKGGDPRTDLFVPSGGEVKTGLFVPSGGEAKTDLFVPSVGEVKTDHFDRPGGDPKTDHIPFSVQMARVVDEMADSPRSGRLATRTAISATVSPALDPDVADSCTLTLGSELRDELPSIVQDPEFRDEFPSIEQDPELRDEFPSIGDLQGQAHSEALNSTSDIENTAISRISSVAEKSERLRESDFGVQIVPASRSPSELSAHHMGLPLAGTSRLKNEPIGVDPIFYSGYWRISTVVYLRSCALAQVQVIRTSAGYFSTRRNLQRDYCGCSEG